MKKIMAGWVFFCFAFSALAQETVAPTIVLPDVRIVIEGDTSIPLQEQTNMMLYGEDIDFGRVDLAELSRFRKSEYYKMELTNQRRSPTFSLSSFRLSYGTSENLFSDINIGKRLDKLNYLVSYLRNSRGSLTISNDKLYNTEFKLDDINVDLIYIPSPNWELQAEIGYYARDLGLYTNARNLAEQIEYFPGRIGFSFIPDARHFLSFAVEGNYLERRNKLINATYTNQTFYHFSPSLQYEVNWAQNNFLKIDARYVYIFQNTLFHEGDVGLVDRLNILANLSLDIGARVYFSSRDPFFWYPLVMIRYHHLDVFLFTLGIDGERKRFLGGDFIEENQYFFTAPVRSDRWTPSVGLQYTPFSGFSLKGNVMYHLYSAYPALAHIAPMDVFTHDMRTNVSLLEAEASLEWTPVKDLVWKTSVTYTLPFTSGLYEVMPLLVSSLLEWDWKNIGLMTTLKATYYPRTTVASGAELSDAVVVNLGFSQQLGEDFYLEVSLDNLFNQNHFHRPSVPRGGFQVSGGIRILL